ncbi:MAG: DUF1538 domain-containing protein [Rhodospirillales bacterium]|nr:MAG: DUF1538 domain-containing protein [Rhodospirillales bacterium]
MDVLLHVARTGGAVALSVAPIIAVLLFFQLAVLRRRLANPRRIITGFAYVLIGLTLFLVGLEKALFPVGRLMAEQLTGTDMVGTAGLAPWWAYGWVYAFGAAIGFAAAMAEPTLIAVSKKAEDVSGGTIRARSLRMMAAAGVGAGVAFGALRIVTGLPLGYALPGLCLIVAFQALTAPRVMVALAFDTGAVGTSTVTVPVVAALGLGLAVAVPDRDPLTDGFGLVAFAVLFTIMAVLAYAWGAAHLAYRRKRAEPGVGR